MAQVLCWISFLISTPVHRFNTSAPSQSCNYTLRWRRSNKRFILLKLHWSYRPSPYPISSTSWCYIMIYYIRNENVMCWFKFWPYIGCQLMCCLDSESTNSLKCYIILYQCMHSFGQQRSTTQMNKLLEIVSHPGEVIWKLSHCNQSRLPIIMSDARLKILEWEMSSETFWPYKKEMESSWLHSQTDV